MCNLKLHTMASQQKALSSYVINNLTDNQAQILLHTLNATDYGNRFQHIPHAKSYNNTHDLVSSVGNLCVLHSGKFWWKKHFTKLLF